MINVMDICNSSTILSVVRIVKVVIRALSIGVPIILLVTCMIDALKNITSNDGEALNKSLKNWVNKIIASVAIFMIPTLISLVISISGENNDYKKCLENANSNKIEQLKKEEEAIKKAAEDKWQQELNRREAERKRQQEQEEAARRSNGYEDTTNRTTGQITSVDIVSIDTTNIGCKLYYSNHTTVFSKLRINKEIDTKMHNILSNVCEYSNRTPWIKQLETAGAYVEKAGYHGKGLAIDLFNKWEFVSNGKTYMPYDGQGSWTYENYKKFICEQCNGKEDCVYNINYQIYYSYFKGNGWCWGGDWSTGYFDPMHYEYNGGNCNNQSTTNRINCG